jgi:hypothetical protein
LFDRIGNRTLDLALVALQEALPIDSALVLAVQPSVYYIRHGFCLLRRELNSNACCSSDTLMVLAAF